MQGWVIQLIELYIQMLQYDYLIDKGVICIKLSVGPGGGWGTEVLAEALSTLGTDMGRMQGLLPELAPQDRCSCSHFTILTLTSILLHSF